MAADGKLPWDDDITPSLVSYTLPPGAQSGDHPVTLAGLLSHTAGTNVHGFPGYSSATQAPTLPEVLAGEGNTEAVRVVTEPGTRFDYSGGGYELVEQAMLDVSGASDFDTLMRELVFEPAGMVDSRYLLDLPADVAARATPGSTDGEQLPQRWQAHPESAAAGLWTTADDLGRFLAALTASMSGVDETLLPTAWTQRMITAVKPAGNGVQVGHGLFVACRGARVRTRWGQPRLQRQHRRHRRWPLRGCRRHQLRPRRNHPRRRGHRHDRHDHGLALATSEPARKTRCGHSPANSA